MFSAAYAVRQSIGAQVACKLALEHFVSGVLDSFESTLGQSAEPGQATIEAAFKRANSSVYDFGHKLAAGGRLAAALFGLVIQSQSVTLGRVGSWSSYLLRDGVVYPFFEETPAFDSVDGEDHFVGAKSLVTIETASVPLAARDVLVTTASCLDAEALRALTEICAETSRTTDAPKGLCQQIAAISEFPLLFFAYIGPEAIYLDQVSEGGL